MDFFRKLRTNLKRSKSGWRYLLPHPIFLIAFLILLVAVVWQAGIIADLVNLGLKTESVRTVTGQETQRENSTTTSAPPPEEKSFWQKINIFSGGSGEEAKQQEEITPKTPDSFNLQFSFSDLFSGKGWKNEEKSNIYQDFDTTSISAPPAYDWQKTEIGLPPNDSEIVAAKGNGRRTVILTVTGGLYSFDSREQLAAYPNMVSAPASARAGFLDFDPDTGQWVAILAGENEERFAILKDDGINQLTKLWEFNRTAPWRENAPGDRSLGCRKGSCLWLSGSEFLTFKESSGPDLRREETTSAWFKDENINSVSSAKIPEGWLLAKVTSDQEKIYKVDIYFWNGELLLMGEGAFSSTYPGRVRFGYDEQNRKIFVVYAAYMGQAAEFELTDKLTLVKSKNFSRAFGARVLGGVAVGSIESFPEIFAQDSAWWIGSSPDSPMPRLLKISPSGGAHSLLQEPIVGSRRLFLLPGYEPHVIYAVLIKDGAVQTYRLGDRGYEQKDNYVWESLRINSGSLPIKFGRVTNALGGGEIRYFLSNDGGLSWKQTKAGEYVVFDAETSDFRWKAELLPFPDQYSTPWLNMVTVEYYQ
ncbi:MAG: hypothetical protein V1856_03260 [Candidatus Liptonbacteria bacterium]